MSQVSRCQPSASVQKKIKQLLTRCINHCNNAEAIDQFLKNILTKTEKIVLGKRLAITLMILKGNSTNEITDILKVSKSTVHNIKASLNDSADSYKNILQRIIKQDRRMERRHQQALKEYESSPIWQRTSGWKGLKAQQREKIKNTEVPF